MYVTIPLLLTAITISPKYRQLFILIYPLNDYGRPFTRLVYIYHVVSLFTYPLLTFLVCNKSYSLSLFLSLCTKNINHHLLFEILFHISFLSLNSPLVWSSFVQTRYPMFSNFASRVLASCLCSSSCQTKASHALFTSENVYLLFHWLLFFQVSLDESTKLLDMKFLELFQKGY